MTGKTLLISRYVKLHSHYEKELKAFGYGDITITSTDKDGLNFVINDIKPKLVLIGAGFYKCATPYMMSMLLRQYPDLNIAAVTHSEYPADLAMWFIFDGVKSYLTFLDGAEEFYEGLTQIRRGNFYVSASVQERIAMRDSKPLPSGPLTRRQLEVARCLCNGFSSIEIGDVLHISESTVNNHKTEMYTTLNVRNEKEIIRTVQDIELISREELIFFGGNYELNPKPTKKLKNEKVPAKLALVMGNESRRKNYAY